MSTRRKLVRLDNLLRDAASVPVTNVVDHGAFRRVSQTVACGDGVEAELLSDFCSPHKITLLYVRFRARESLELSVSLTGATQPTHGKGFLARSPRGGSLWLPVGPATRRYDRHGRIESEVWGDVGIAAPPGTPELRFRLAEGEVADVALVLDHSNEQEFVREIVATEPIETIRLNQDGWYDVDHVAQLWTYLIHGRVHDPRWESTGTRIECQQCAHTWYTHLTYLHRCTGKRIYGALRDTVAHAVLLTLPNDHRWRHGEWTDGMETHARFQTDGIHLLLQHYSVCGDARFLDGACGATDYLLGIADALDENRVWYLHDTLELEDDPARSGFPRSHRSRAFGKRVSNTLCLNTHAWTLTALSRLAKICGRERRERYEQALTRGMCALRTVLSSQPGEVLYGGMYGLRDVCLKLTNRPASVRALKLCDAVLRRALRSSKPRLPRLVMPNGYIERDLERSILSDRYVPVNLKDLALLYTLTGADWLRPLVERGLSHWIDSGLWSKELARSPTVQQTLDAALLLTAVDPTHRILARRLYEDLRIAGRAVTVDAVAGTAGTDAWTIEHTMPDVLSDLLSAATNAENPGRLRMK